jgi:hypothetical protein
MTVLHKDDSTFGVHTVQISYKNSASNTYTLLRKFIFLPILCGNNSFLPMTKTTFVKKASESELIIEDISTLLLSTSLVETLKLTKKCGSVATVKLNWPWLSKFVPTEETYHKNVSLISNLVAHYRTS